MYVYTQLRFPLLLCHLLSHSLFLPLAFSPFLLVFCLCLLSSACMYSSPSPLAVSSLSLCLSLSLPRNPPNHNFIPDISPLGWTQAAEDPGVCVDEISGKRRAAQCSPGDGAG